MVDFGIEESFHQAAQRMKEHHGVDINVSAIRYITETHAGRAIGLLKKDPSSELHSPQMILEMDGEMLPLVEYQDSKDKRKTKKNLWGELRISTVQNHGEVSWKYAS